MKEVSMLADIPKQARGDSWSAGRSTQTFPTHRVDVWRVHLDAPVKADVEAAGLSADEMTRASRFHFERDKTRFIRCRSALRELLSGYMTIPKFEIRFEYLPTGKPQLSADQNPCQLQFNVSHSAGMALIAVSSKYRLGVDIEAVRSNVDTDSLAERFFSMRERIGLRALPDHLRLPGFYACWTRKEAFLKATGRGLSFPLADFSVTTHPDLNPQLEEINPEEINPEKTNEDPEAGKQWFLADLRVVDGYRAAIAMNGPSCPVETYAWN
jgi:4'-phosphopantetheinyl transferase